MNQDHPRADHLTAGDLMAVMYETAELAGQAHPSAGQAHVDSCAYCRQRMESMRMRRQDGASPPMSPAMLARQRSAIYARLDSRPVSHRWVWASVPLAAAAAVLLMVNPPWNADESADEAVQNQQITVQKAGVEDTLYSDIYQSLSVAAPSSISATAGVFEQQKSGTMQ